MFYIFKYVVIPMGVYIELTIWDLTFYYKNIYSHKTLKKS